MCYSCQKDAHFKGSEACPNQKEDKVKTRATAIDSDNTNAETDSDLSFGCMKVLDIEEPIRSVQGNKSKLAKIKLTALDSGRPSLETDMNLLIRQWR